MARGDMSVQNATFGSGAEILNRPPFEGVSITIDFEGASANGDYKEDKASGEFYVPAGMPIGKDGKPHHETFTDVVGILLTDVYQHRPQGTIVTEGYINKKRAEASFGGTYTSDIIASLVNAGCRIRIEGDTDDELVVGKISAGE